MDYFNGVRALLFFQMIVDAHAACKSENMNCPWCSGKVSPDKEEHDQFCNWPAIEKKHKELLAAKERPAK